MVARGMGRSYHSLPIEYSADGHHVWGIDDGDEVVWKEFTPPEFARFMKRKCPFRAMPGRFMYKSLARTLCRVTAVRAQCIQDISEDDAVAEGWDALGNQDWRNGVPITANLRTTGWGNVIPRAWFIELWDGINKKRSYGFDANPWVFAYTVEVVEMD
jgi:hypothetical protein